MNVAKLKGKLRECGISYANAADNLDLSRASFNNKINGRSKFYIDEIEKLGHVLNLSDAEKIDIFLP